jgi:hypothetical protein
VAMLCIAACLAVSALLAFTVRKTPLRSVLLLSNVETSTLGRVQTYRHPGRKTGQQRSLDGLRSVESAS